METFQCEQCENSFKTVNGLKIHIGKAHKVLKHLPSHEMVCDNPQDTSLVMSPLRDTRREEDKKEEVEEDIRVPEEETLKPHLVLNETLEWNAGNKTKQK